MSIRESICKAALAIAEITVRNHQNAFVFMGAYFVLDWISDREAVVCSAGKDAGIRIYDGIAEFA